MTVCVYGAASNDIDKRFLSEGEELGRKLAEADCDVVFGGGANGLMGAVARGVKEKNGKIVSVVPSFFNVDGVLFEASDEQIFTETMRIRKQTFEEMSDAFIITPGGIGTFDEFFEILTLRSLKQHNKLILILNTLGYFDKLLEFLKDGEDKGFIRNSANSLYFVSQSVDEIIDYINDIK